MLRNIAIVAIVLCFLAACGNSPDSHQVTGPDRAEVEALQRDLEELRERFERESKEYQTQIGDMRDALDDLTSQKREIEAEIDHRREEVRQLEAEVREAKEELEHWKDVRRDVHRVHDALVQVDWSFAHLMEELDAALQQGNIELIYRDVTGPIDRWWRSPDWIARSSIRYLSTPAHLRVAIHRDQVANVQRQLASLRSAVSDIETAEVLAALPEVLLVQVPELVRCDPSRERSLAIQFERLGTLLHEAFDEGGRRNARIDRMFETASHQLRNSSYSNVSRPRIDIRGADLMLDPRELDRDVALDHLLATVIILEEMCEARAASTALVYDLLAAQISAERVDNFYRSTYGPINTIRVVWASRGTWKLDEVLLQRFEEHVLSEDDAEDFLRSINDHYSESLERAAARVFDEASKSPVQYPRVKDVMEEIVMAEREAEELGDTTFNRVRIVAEALSLPLLAFDAALIVGGLVAAPKTAGLSLIATAVGFAHLAFEGTMQALAVTDNDQRATSVRAATQSSFTAVLLGSDGVEVEVADAVIIPALELEDAALDRLDGQFLGEYDSIMAIFGE